MPSKSVDQNEISLIGCFTNWQWLVNNQLKLEVIKILIAFGFLCHRVGGKELPPIPQCPFYANGHISGTEEPKKGSRKPFRAL